MNSIVPYSDSNPQPSVFSFNGHDVRLFLIDNEEWWVATDVCDPLGIVNVSDAVNRLDDDEKSTIVLTDSGRPKKVLLVNEPGLYALIGSSRKPVAKSFRRWVNHEVLPSIRKTGSYSLQNVSPDELIVLLAQQNVETRKQIEALKRQQDELQRNQADQAIGLEATNERITQSEYYTVRQWCQLQRLNVKYTVMQQWGKAAAALSRHREIEIQRVNEGENNVGCYYKSILMEVCVIKPKADPDQLKLGA